MCPLGDSFCFSPEFHKIHQTTKEELGQNVELPWPDNSLESMPWGPCLLTVLMAYSPLCPALPLGISLPSSGWLLTQHHDNKKGER